MAFFQVPVKSLAGLSAACDGIIGAENSSNPIRIGVIILKEVKPLLEELKNRLLAFPVCM